MHMFISVLALFFYFQTKINSVRQQLCSVQGILTSASDTYVEDHSTVQICFTYR